MSETQRALILASAALLAAISVPAVGRTPMSSLGSIRLATEAKPVLGSEDVIAVRFSGRFPNQPSAPEHLTFTGGLLSPTGEAVGSLTLDIVCLTTVPLPCPVVDSTTTFRFPEGQIVSRAIESIAPDPANPGFALIGIHPAGHSIVSATGAFKGRRAGPTCRATTTAASFLATSPSTTSGSSNCADETATARAAETYPPSQHPRDGSRRPDEEAPDPGLASRR